MASNGNIFKGVTDKFHGVTVDSEKEACNTDEFSNKLCESLKYWTNNKRRFVWFKVCTEQAEWVPILAKVNSTILINNVLIKDVCMLDHKREHFGKTKFLHWYTSYLLFLYFVCVAFFTKRTFSN